MKRRYEFLGESIGTNVSNWLNCVPAGKEKNRVVLIVKAATSTLATRYKTITRLLQAIALTPGLESSFECGVWSSWNLARGGPFKDRKIEIESGWARYGFADALVGVVTLTEQGLCGRIRQCQCGSWFYGKSEVSQYCSFECMNAFRNKTERFRQRRREYMRDYKARRAGKREKG